MPASPEPDPQADWLRANQADLLAHLASVKQRLTRHAGRSDAAAVTLRPVRAAELYKAGAAPWILCSGLGDCDANVQRLERAGVPAAAILREELSRNTSENARFSLPILRRLGAKRVIIVTSWYHSRRARQVFRHYGPDLSIYSRPAYAGCPASRWAPQAISGHVKSEYLKLMGYWARYGVFPI